MQGVSHEPSNAPCVLRDLQLQSVLSRKIIEYWGGEANALGTQISAMHRQ